MKKERANIEKRVNIDQELCNHARILIAGGATTAMAADMLGIGRSTVQKIRQARYDAQKYQQLKKYEKERVAEKAAQQAEEQCPGQMKMELPEKEAEEQNKQNRFTAAMVDRMVINQAQWVDSICLKLDKLNDTLSMLLRALRKE